MRKEEGFWRGELSSSQVLYNNCYVYSDAIITVWESSLLHFLILIYMSSHGRVTEGWRSFFTAGYNFGRCAAIPKGEKN